MPPFKRISTSLAVEALVEAVEEFNEYEAKRAKALADRNQAIRDAAEFIPRLRLAKITGLSREQVYRIATTGVRESA